MIRQFNRVTPIVAVTSDIKPSHVMTYFTAGMTDVLGKPFSKAELSEILEVCDTFTFPFSNLIGCHYRNTFHISNRHPRGRRPRGALNT